MILNALTTILIINSIIIIILILNQNESAKDGINTSTNNEIANPLQNLTWLCVIMEFILLLLKSKITD